jgi:hypothetical protein
MLQRERQEYKKSVYAHVFYYLIRVYLITLSEAQVIWRQYYDE